MKYLEIGQGKIVILLLEADNDFCVVGNSPCERGKGYGARIDDFRYVIRFNNFATEREYWHDYGRKANIWVRTPLMVKRRFGYKPDLGILPYTVMWRFPNGQDVVIDLKSDKHIIDSRPMAIVARTTLELGVIPSSGLAILTWISQNIKIRRDQVYGFIFVDQEEGAIHYYEEDSIRKDITNHNWSKELEMFKSIVD